VIYVKSDAKGEVTKWDCEQLFRKSTKIQFGPNLKFTNFYQSNKSATNNRNLQALRHGVCASVCTYVLRVGFYGCTHVR